MSEPSTAFSSLNPVPPKVVGINYGIFQTPEDPLNPFVETVPVDYRLYISLEQAPDPTVGTMGDWFIRSTTDSLVMYQKGTIWRAKTTLTGAASADLTAVYNDLNALGQSVIQNQAKITSIESTFATQSYAQAIKQEAITASNQYSEASVVGEAYARAQADGYLSGKYTLKVTAGNVVTGMNITSSSGAGQDVSEVVFQANSFKIYNGSSAQAVFDLNGSEVRISGWVINPSTLVGGNTSLNSTGVITVGTGDNVAVMSSADGTYRFWAGNANPALAPFSVDKAGNVKATNGVFSGTISSTSGTIAGFTINSYGLSASFVDGSSVTIYANGTYIAYGATGSGRMASFTSSGPVMQAQNATDVVLRTQYYTHISDFKITADGTMKWGDRDDGGGWKPVTLYFKPVSVTGLPDGSLWGNGYLFFDYFRGDGSHVTNIDAGNIASGTLSASRLPFTPGNLASLNISAFTGTADAPIVGYVEIPDSGGTLRKLAVIS